MRVYTVSVIDDHSEIYRDLMKVLLQASPQEVTFSEVKTEATVVYKSGNKRVWLCPFKKYKGKTIEQIPSDYISWQLSTYRKNMLEKEQGRDKGNKLFILNNDTLAIFEGEARRRNLSF